VKKIADARQGGLEAHGPVVVLGKGWGPVGMYAVKKGGADKKPDAVVFAMRVKGDDVVRFIVSGQSVHLPKLKEVANQLQRIPAPMPSGSFLYGPKPHQSTRADQMRDLLVDQTGGGTVAQGHSDWYISRFFKLTASMLPTLVPRVRQANPGRCSVFLSVLRFAGDAHHNEEPLPDVVPEELRAEEDRSRATLATVLEAELTAQIPPPPPPPPLPPPPPADDNAAVSILSKMKRKTRTGYLPIHTFCLRRQSLWTPASTTKSLQKCHSLLLRLSLPAPPPLSCQISL